MFCSQTFYTSYSCVSELASYCTVPLIHITHTISQKGFILLRNFVYVFLSRVWTLVSPLSCDGDLNDTTSIRALMICSGDPASVCYVITIDASRRQLDVKLPFLFFAFLISVGFYFSEKRRCFHREGKRRKLLETICGNEDHPNKSWQYLWRRMLWLRDVLFTYSICQRDSIRMKLTVSR